MLQTELTSDWREWILINLGRNCSVDSMVDAMSRSAFDRETATRHVAQVLVEVSAGKAVSQDNGKETLRNHYQYEGSRIARGNSVQTRDRVISVAMRVEQPDVVLLRSVLSIAECEELIRRSQVKLKQSTTVDRSTGENKVIADRSSRGTYFMLEEDDLISDIDRRLSDLTNWPIERTEGIQILNYGLGGEYKPHFDYFPPDDSGSSVHMAQGGQRIATIVMYLNDVEEGGETIFPKVHLSITPHRGDAVYFGYCDKSGHVDPLTLHGGAPVRRGEKWIATKWLRQHKR